jgi:general secretion pathway protein F
MQYKITYQTNNSIKTKNISASSAEDILHQMDNIIKIEQRTFLKKKFSSSITKEEVHQLFSQISLMLDSGLTFIQAIEIIEEKNSKKQMQQILQTIKEVVIKSLPIEEVLQPYKKYLGTMPIVFLKLGIENGNIKESIRSLVEILKEELSVKKQLLQAIRYPLFLFISFCIALVMVFIYVLPNFEFIFQNLQTIPLATKVLLFLKKALYEYYVISLVAIITIGIVIIFIYRKYPLFFEKVFLENIFLISKILRFYHLYKLFLAMGIIVRSKYQFQVAIQNAQVIIENRYLKKLMQNIMEDIKQGNNIVHSFAKYKLFDEVTIKLLTTAENTSKYENILSDLANYYKVNFETSIENFESYFEPIMILFIAMIVLWLVLAIMVPIWDLGTLAL